MTVEPNQTDLGWHLDRKVPISIIVALFVQFLGGVWFLSKLEARIIALEALQFSQRERDERQDKTVTESHSLLRSDVQEVGRKLDRLIESGNRLLGR